jgi:hypothetical protein
VIAAIGSGLCSKLVASAQASKREFGPSNPANKSRRMRAAPTGARRQAEQQQQTFQQMTQEVMSTYSELFNIPISYAKEGLREAQFPIEGYDELTVDKVSACLGSLSVEDLREVRDYEERTKN